MSARMSVVEGFCFVSQSGLIATAQVGVDLDPYMRAEEGPASRVWHEGIAGAQWTSSGKCVDVRFDESVLAYPSPSMRQVVVVLSEQSRFPNNALVLNADGTIRHHVRQPQRYAGQATGFLDVWWYERDMLRPQPPWWAFWRKPIPPKKEIRMKMLIGWIGDSTFTFEALDFDPETGAFGDLVDSGRL